MKLAASPIADGYVPCGACRQYVEKCPHYRQGHLRIHRDPGRSTEDAVRAQAVRKADGYCQGCGHESVLLHVRAVTAEYSYTTLSADNAVALCTDCRSASLGKSLRRWVQNDRFAPDLAREFIRDRIDRGLPV